MSCSLRMRKMELAEWKLLESLLKMKLGSLAKGN